MRQSEKPFFIGITGGIGAGKSELLGYIQKHYLCEIYLADEAAHLVKAPGTKCYEALKELLGSDIAAPSGEIDRSVMADRIFQDEGLLEKVNEIVHPAVREFLMEKLAKARENPKVELFFVEAALLIEAGYRNLVDEMWYIYADEQSRAGRLKRARGYSESKIRHIMERQLTDDAFRDSCDVVIDNSGSLEDSYRQIEKQLEAFTWQE